MTQSNTNTRNTPIAKRLMQNIKKLARPEPLALTVVESYQLTPNMQRVIVTGNFASRYEQIDNTSHFKMQVPQIDNPEEMVTRTYTVRHYDANKQHLHIDFALHESPGPAAHWALHVKPGDPARIIGIGSAKWLNHNAPWYLLAGDMSALPAIAANLEALPNNAMGKAVIEIMDEADKQSLTVPAGVDINWVINPNPNQENSVLFDAVRHNVGDLHWHLGKPSIWVAGEGSAVQKIRRLFLDEYDMSRREMYTSSYWQIGLTEDAHQQAKRSQR